jgi:hypothetical protein
MFVRTRLLPVALLCTLPACGLLRKKQTDSGPAASVTATAVASAAPSAAATVAQPEPKPEPTVTDEAIAAPEDFEDEAFEKVSDKTYKSEFEDLKKQIEEK